MKAIAIAIALAVNFAAVPGVLACDAPGTPNPVTAQVISNSEIGLRITNTAREGSDRDIWFMVQNQSGEVRRFTQGHVNYGQTVDYIVDNLKPNTSYCFEVWTRDDDEKGCRSKEPSGWACGHTKND